MPLLSKSWEKVGNWDEVYNTIIKNARIIKESGILQKKRVTNGGFVDSADSPDTYLGKE
ncbi:MAG: hypothetical protein FWE50_03250 [Alphaproteobacteria bacterium]|nr:hypothetical protein [Alphaproteobacteria bacterium]